MCELYHASQNYGFEYCWCVSVVLFSHKALLVSFLTNIFHFYHKHLLFFLETFASFRSTNAITVSFTTVASRKPSESGDFKNIALYCVKRRRSR